MNVHLNEAVQVIEVSLKWVDVLSIFTGIASLVLAIVAIWLSFKFYQMSVGSSDKIHDSSVKINNNVEKLEKMFDSMYSDTFGMVKDTVSHMRRQVDKGSSNSDYSSEINSKVEELISSQLKKVPPENLNEDRVKEMVMDVLKESKTFEEDIKKKNMKKKVLEILNKEDYTSFRYLEKSIIGENPDSGFFGILFEAVHELYQEGIINADFHQGLSVSTESPITLTKKSRGND